MKKKNNAIKTEKNKLNNMKKIVMCATVIAVVSLMACGGADKSEIDSSIVPSQTGKQVTNAFDADTNVTQPLVVNPVTLGGQPVTTIGSQPITNAAPVKTAPVSGITGGSGPNPAHGQPGHRCDISVGAPLNSPVGNAAKPQVQTVPSTPSVALPSVLSVPSAVTTPVSTDPNAKLNPAHGQPGHDCAIAVGAPLKKN